MRPARLGAITVAVATALALSAADGAHAQSNPDAPSGYFLTIVARHCPDYEDIRPNLARNNIQESLENLGAGVSPYTTGQQISPTIETPNHPKCKPLVGWKFQLGTGLSGSKTGTWGRLSLISGPISPWSIAKTSGEQRTRLPVITTEDSVPDRDQNGAVVAGSALPGATTVELTNAQATSAGEGDKVSIQGGTVADPALAEIPGLGNTYAFGALRCGIDNLNGDNVEWIRFGGRKHIYCYAYYVTPPPQSATVIVKKRVTYPEKATATFNFRGNISYTAAQDFSLTVTPDTSSGAVAPFNKEPSITFYRAATRSGDPPWTFTETGSVGYLLTGINCTSRLGSTIATDRGTASVQITNLLAADQVECVFINEQRPQGGTLQIAKTTTGAVGTFPFTVEPVDGGGAPRTTTARTLIPGVEADALPGPLALDPGQYRITETLPERSGGQWRQVSVNCNSRPLSSRRRGAPATVVTVTAATGVACRFTNSFIPEGSITIAKTAISGSGTSGFVISYEGAPPRKYVQSADVGEGETVIATGDSTNRLPLGRYVIQETATLTDDVRPWTLVAVECDGELTPFEEKRITVELTAEHPDVACRFENQQTTTPLPDPRPTPTPTPPAPQPLPAQPAAPADLVVTKRALSSTTRVGELAAFTVTVRNAGEGVAENVALADRPRRRGQIATASASQGSCSERLTLTCHLGTLAPGESATVRVRVRATAPGVLSNVAVAGSGTSDRQLRNNVDRERTLVLPARGPRRCANAASADRGPVAHASC